VSPAGATYDKYEEISGGGKDFYKWSNDNQVYTELSAEGFQEVSDGYIVFFVGEFPSLDNSKTGEDCNAPRNTGFTKISKDQKKKLSPGGKETGGFYDFGGGWNEASNEGIVQLSKFSSNNEFATRLKNFKLNDEQILLLFEVWDTKCYQYTAYMVVDNAGTIVVDTQKIDFPMRIHKSDMAVKNGGDILIVCGEAESKIATYTIKMA